MSILSATGFYKHEVSRTGKMKLAPQLCRCICELPEILQRFFFFRKLTGKESIREVKIRWTDAKLRLAPGKKWTPITCQQINILPTPVRLVYMKAHFLGLLPLNAVDEYIDGKGLMLIKLANMFTLSRNKGREMDKAELVTTLAETMLVPAYALQYYITWQVIDELCVKGTIRYNNVSASGLFRFDPSGRPLSFETNDRYYTASDGKYHQYKWSAYLKQTSATGALNFSAVWHLPEGEHEYFSGKIAEIYCVPFISYQSTKKPSMAFI